MIQLIDDSVILLSFVTFLSLLPMRLIMEERPL